MPQDMFEYLVKQSPDLTGHPLRLHVDGEPALHPKFIEYAEFLNNLNIPFVIATNGSLLSEKLLDLKMDVLISISTNNKEFQRRTAPIDYATYLEGIIDYLQGWLHSDSDQAIQIQIPFYGFPPYLSKGNLIANLPRIIQYRLYAKTKNDFIQRIERQLDLTKHAKKLPSNKHLYQKSNGYTLSFHNWGIDTRQAYRPESRLDKFSEKGFCSSPWQELAVLADGRVSFCCRDLTGGTAFTAKEEIWDNSLLDFWRDKRIVNIRRNFMNKRVQLNVCQRCLADLPNYTHYKDDLLFYKFPPPKHKGNLHINSLGNP